MYATIIAALDGSDQSMLALKHARAMAESFGAKLILVHAFPHTYDLRDAAHYNKLVAMRTIEGQAIIDAAKKAIGDTSIEIEEELLEGPVADAIISSASIRKVDLIVMGSRGMGSLKGLVFGSVSNKVSQYAPCAVLVVR